MGGNLHDGAASWAHSHRSIGGQEEHGTAGVAGDMDLLDGSDTLAAGASDGGSSEGIAKGHTAITAGDLSHTVLLLVWSGGRRHRALVLFYWCIYAVYMGKVEMDVCGGWWVLGWFLFNG